MPPRRPVQQPPISPPQCQPPDPSSHPMFENLRPAPAPPAIGDPQGNFASGPLSRISTGYALTVGSETLGKRCLSGNAGQEKVASERKHATESTLPPSSKSARKFLGIGKRGDDSRRRLMDTLQRSIFKIVPRKTHGETHGKTDDELNQENDDGRTVRRAMSQEFNADRLQKPLPRTASKSERVLLATKSEERRSRFGRSLLDLSEITPSRKKAELRDAQDTPGSTGTASFARGLRNSILGLVDRARGGDKDGDLATPSKRQLEHSSKRQIRSTGVSFDALRGTEGEHRAERKRNASMIELNIGNPVLVDPPAFKTLVSLDVAQNDPMIRQRSHGSFERIVEPNDYMHRLSRFEDMAVADQVDPWLLDAMESFDEELLNPAMVGNPNIARDKASTPSQEIIEQTKAAWKEQNHGSKIFQETSIVGSGPAFAQRSLRSRSPVQTPPRVHMPTPSNPLWSDLQDTGISTMPTRTKHSTLMSEKKQAQRQTRSFHGFSTAEQSSNLESAKSRSNQTSQRLQAILGVETSQLLASKSTNSMPRSPKSRNFVSRLPIRTSSILPLHHRRESSVYGSGGPTTPPPSAPLPAIPSSESQASLRTASTNPLVLYTPISPAASLGTSVNHWSWRLAPDSLGSQLLNEMKVATDISRVRRTGDTVIPTKRHIHQRSVSSSALSAIMLDDTALQKTLPRRGIADIHNSIAEDQKHPPKVLRDGRHIPHPDSKSFGSSSAFNISSSSGPSEPGALHSDSPSTSNSAGSPSSIVDLYMHRSQPNLRSNM